MCSGIPILPMSCSTRRSRSRRGPLRSSRVAWRARRDLGDALVWLPVEVFRSIERRGRRSSEMALSQLVDERCRLERGGELGNDCLAQPLPALVVTPATCRRDDWPLPQRRTGDQGGPNVTVARPPTSRSRAPGVAGHDCASWACADRPLANSNRSRRSALRSESSAFASRSSSLPVLHLDRDAGFREYCRTRAS